MTSVSSDVPSELAHSEPVQLHPLQIQYQQEQAKREQLLHGANGDRVDNGINRVQTPANRFIPYHSATHSPTKGRYITSNDARGYIPVYEYPLNGQWIMMDMDDGYILWTGIWKALGNHKADIVKMLESQPELATQLRRVRGGYLKIQGTWLAYEVALRLARRVAWPIRHDLVPLFGPTFPTTCLAPDQPGYGTVIPPSGRRKPRRSLQSVGIPPPHSVPYPPKLPLAKEFALGARPQPHGESPMFRSPNPMLSGSPVDTHAMPFVPPTIPSVPALVPVSGVAYSPQEPSSASSYSSGQPAPYASSKHRFSPYAFPKRHHSPSLSAYSGYEGKPHPLVHRASDPNLRAYHARGHVLVPRLSLNNLHLPTGEIKRQLPIARPDGADPVDKSHPPALEDAPSENLGITSIEDSIPTPPYEVSPSFDPSWHVGHGTRWPETPVDYVANYDHGPQYYGESVPSYSDASLSSPPTAWSYDAYSLPSPAEQHLYYPPIRSSHHRYSSMSSTTSFNGRRLSMAESMASSFPEPDAPIPQVAYHRYSQPQIYQPLPPPHLDYWMRERSGSFAEPSYAPVAGGIHSGEPPAHQTIFEHQEMLTMVGPHEFTPSPRSSHTPAESFESQEVSTPDDVHVPLYNPQTVLLPEAHTVTVW